MPLTLSRIGRNLLCFTGGLQRFIHPCSQDISGALGRISKGRNIMVCYYSLPWCKTHFLWICQRGDYQPGQNHKLKVCLKWLWWGLLRGRRGARAKLGRKHQFPTTQQRCSAVKLCLSAIFLLAARLQLKASLQPVK